MCPGRGPPDDAPPLVEDIFLRQRELVMGNTAPTGHVDRDLEKDCQKEKFLFGQIEDYPWLYRTVNIIHLPTTTQLSLIESPQRLIN